jgi:uncharacterized membrane protein (DUF485 family)
MSTTRGAGGGRADDQIARERYAGTASGSTYHPEIDWEAAERSPEFRELIKKKKAFVIPATAFFLAWYFGFIVLAGYAPDFMGREFLVDGLTVGYAFALTQFIMVWALGWLYLRRADRDFDPLAERAAAQAIHEGREAAGSGRFERSPADEEVRRP